MEGITKNPAKAGIGDSDGLKAVIFDLGNVLVDFDHRIAAARISKFTDKTREAIFKLFFDSRLTGIFEEGKISPPDFFSKVKEALNLNLSFDEFVPIWNDIFFLTEKNLGVYNLARALKNRYKTALLSNINILHFGYIKKTFPILDAFDYCLTSFELGLTKPEIRIYQEALAILGVSASEAFYTDDRPELVASAKELGIRGFLFQGVEKLKNDLRDAGVKI